MIQKDDRIHTPAPLTGDSGGMTGGRSRNRHWCILTIGVVLTLGVAACGSTAKVGAPQQATTATTVAKTKKPPSVNGLHTVLSPIGVNIRANPAKTAAVVASAAQGVGVHVVGHSAQDGGWLEVKGASVTGWMTADPALSAPGMFTVFAADSGAFGVLYPSAWTANEVSPAVTVFAPSASRGIGRRSVPGQRSISSGSAAPDTAKPGLQQIVACGVTTYVVTYTRDGPVGATTTAAPTTTTTTTAATGGHDGARSHHDGGTDAAHGDRDVPDPGPLDRRRATRPRHRRQLDVAVTASGRDELRELDHVFGAGLPTLTTSAGNLGRCAA